jgi:hypothetical protein
MGAIYIDPTVKRAKINADECVECYACYNGLSQEVLPPRIVRFTRKVMSFLLMRFEPDPDICPTAAFEPDELTWPRVVRRAFSDPRVPHESTGIAGRGTEEVKTNDVTHRVSVGEVGFTVEFGRPGVGARFHEIQQMSQALAALGVSFEERNPLTSLMTDTRSGTFRDDILNEKVLSAILEIKVAVERTEEVILAIWAVKKRLKTLVVLGIGTRCDENGEEREVMPILERLGYSVQRAKTNLGLGRAVIAPQAKSSADQSQSRAAASNVV